MKKPNVKRYRNQNTRAMTVLPIQDSSTKYGNKWCLIDGHKFQSIREGGYYQFLKAEKQAGRIKDFGMQVKFTFAHNGTTICSYFADFVVYRHDGRVDVIDVKGFKTDVYKLKKKMMKAFFDIDIIEK